MHKIWKNTQKNKNIDKQKRQAESIRFIYNFYAFESYECIIYSKVQLKCKENQALLN